MNHHTTTPIAPTRAYTFGDIERAVCSYYAQSIEDVYSPCRDRELVLCRHTIALFAMEFMNISHKKAGQHMGRNRTTVLRSCSTIRNWMDTDDRIRGDVVAIRGKIVSHTLRTR